MDAMDARPGRGAETTGPVVPTNLPAAAAPGPGDPLLELAARYPEASFTVQPTADGIPTVWVPAEKILEILRYLKSEAGTPYRMLYDLTAVDERERRRREGLPAADFSVVYHLLSIAGNRDIRVKVPLSGEYPEIPTATSVWPSADWYEREAFDMFGLRFSGHPRLRRILMPDTWKGHPLRKEHPARATEMAPFSMDEARALAEQEALRFRPEEWGMETADGDDGRDLVVNIGPQHPGTHGVLRVVLRLQGERVVDAVCDIGYHHRGAEKMGERQSWHSYIPYTDRVDYLGGVMNNLPYCLAVEKLAAIEVPDRAKVIRVMMCEFFRLASHLVWYGTFAQDLGQLSPVFYMFTDRERVLDIVAAVTGARMHPNWFRIGGTAQDLPRGWEDLVAAFVRYFRPRLRDYDGMVMKNRILKARSVGIGAVTLEEAIEWGVTGPMLRACGLEWDFRKKRPYSGYEFFDFDIPTGTNGDVYDRALVRVEEMRQSVRIIEQCLKDMPAGETKARHPLAAPPIKDMTLKDIETLINHFLGVGWGPVMPPGEAFCGVEATKGNTGYYLISDGGVMSYRTRIRTPSFPHIQMVPLMTRGFSVPDFVAILGSIDFVLADVDR